MDKNLAGKVAIVTGARRGMGKATAMELAARGAKVTVSDIDEAECAQVVSEIKQAGGEAIAVKCDVTNAAEVNAMIEKTVSQFGKLDIMVNNAGIVDFKPLAQMTEEDFLKTINVDLKGVFLCSKAAAVKMAQAKSGRIINIASIAARVGYPMISQYCAAKAGVTGLTRSLAVELAPMGINVNAILPGVFDTPMSASVKTDPNQLKATLARVPKGRMGKPEEIAHLVCFLASDDADYITGTEIVIDGGWTVNPN